MTPARPGLRPAFAASGSTFCCTMAVTTHLLLGLLDIADPGRVSRVAVRFASPTPLGAELTVNAFGINENSFGFEAAANGTTTITNGRLELRP